MKLKAVVESLDDVDEKYRDLYVAYDDDGTEKFKLDVDGIGSHPETTRLSSAHERTKGRVRELNAQIAELQDRADAVPEDFDADLYARAVSEGVGGGGAVKNEAEIRREASEAATTRAEAKAKKVTDALTAERDRLKARVENTEKRTAVDAALDEAKVTDPAYRRAARALLMQDVVVHYDGDNIEVLAKDATLGDIPVAEHVKAWAGSDEGKAFVGPRESAGGGANGDGPGGKAPAQTTGNPWKTETFNATQQALLKRENPTLAAKYQREAGITV